MQVNIINTEKINFVLIASIDSMDTYQAVT